MNDFHKFWGKKNKFGHQLESQFPNFDTFYLTICFPEKIYFPEFNLKQIPDILWGENLLLQKIYNTAYF